MKKSIYTISIFLMIASTVFVSAKSMEKTVINKSRCAGCGDCVRICPVDAITMVRGKAVIDVEKCVGCKMCIQTCSYGAPQ